MKFHRKIVAISAISVGGLVIFAALAINTNKQLKQAGALIDNNYMLIKDVEEVSAHVASMESDFTSYVISSSQNFERSFADDSLQIVAEINSLEKLSLDNPFLQQNIILLKQYFREKSDSSSFYIHNPQYISEKAKTITAQDTDIVAKSIEAVLNDILTKENYLLKQHIAINNKSEHNSLMLAVAFGVAFLIFLLIMLRLLNKDYALRKKAEKVALENEKKYLRLINGAGVVMFTADLNGYFTFISTRVLELTGYSRKELIGKHYSYLIPERWLDVVAEVYQSQLKRQEQESLLEFPILTKEAAEKWVEQTTTLLSDGQEVNGFECVVRDIDQRKKMQWELEATERERQEITYRLQSILDNSVSSIFIKDLEGRYLLVNKQFEKVSGYSSSDVIGKTDYELYPQLLADQYTESDKYVITKVVVQETEDIVKSDNNTHYYMTVKFPLLNDSGKVYGVAGIATDITDRKENEKALVQAKHEAEEARLTQEQFLANMSHEIRTPMNGIIGMIDLLKDSSLEAAQREFVDAIFESANNLLVIIDDILDFSKIRAGKLTLEEIPFNLEKVVRDTVFLLHLKAVEKKIKVTVDIDKAVPREICGDPHRLWQILNNLVGNAIKFTEKGTVAITINPELITDTTVKIAFTVKDSGIGIATDQLQNIFEGFKQAGKNISRKYGGSGLGLNISKQLVELQNGNISVDSQLGKGSIFYFTIPYTLSKVQHKQADKNIDIKGKLKGKHILVAEDNTINQKVILYSLRKVGVIAELAETGRQAINKLSLNHHIDLVLMDVHMPEMNGWDATRYIRNELNQSLPVIAMTATALKKDINKCFEAGMDDFIPKPFGTKDLYSKIAQHLPDPGMSINTGEAIKEPESENILYDLSLVNEMEDDQYSLEVLQMFVDRTDAGLQQIYNHIKMQAWELVSNEAHKLKSSCGLLGIASLAEKLDYLEIQAMNNPNKSKFVELLHEMKDVFQIVKKQLLSEIKRLEREHDNKETGK